MTKIARPKTVAFLQNAWSPCYAGDTWPRASWLDALANCHSGARLKKLGLSWESYYNTTPIVGRLPSSKVPADSTHIREILQREQPALVVACGLQAEQALAPLWEGWLLAIPHPASRVLTNALYEESARRIAGGPYGRVALRQRRGFFEVETLAQEASSV